MVKVIWTRMAQDHKDEAIAYGAEVFGKKSTIKLNNKIKESLETLSAYPQIGKIEPLLEDSALTYRSLTIHKNYKLVYYIEDDTVVVADIWDTRQEPAYLKNRLEE